MLGTERPRTAEEQDALPEGSAFGTEERMINGQLMRAPVAPDVVAVFHDDHDIICWVGKDGESYSIGRFANGQWFKRRG